MKILILGNSASQWQKNFVKQALLPLGHKVFELSDRNNSTYQNSKSENDIFLLPKYISPLLMKIPKIRAAAILNSNIITLKERAPYDVIINMFVSNSNLFCARFLKRKKTRMIVYFCGSDILRLSGFKLFILRHNMKYVDSIVFASEKVKKGFFEKCGSFPNKYEKVIYLGNSVFDKIDSVKRNGINSRMLLQIPESKKTVCIGYNGNPGQQHIAIIEQLSKLPKEDRDKIHLIIPMTYSGTELYYQQVENALSELGFSYSIFNEYMDEEKMAMIHCSIDVFINAQKTDGLSASVIESIYAGAILLNAKWLEYPEYSKWGINYEFFQSFEELPGLIEKVIRNEITHHDNRIKIYQNITTWESTKNEWEKLLLN